MRTLTELQAYDAAIRWLRMHVESMGDPPLSLLLADMEYRNLDDQGCPISFDWGEWEEWTRCITATLDESGPR
jgi:hypothetical protein